jgi:hypothetical protein
MENKQLALFKKNIENYTGKSPFDSSLLIATQGDIDVYFSPFEYVNTEAKIVLVGISPGATQAHNANVAAQASFVKGLPDEKVSQLAKETASFSGALRKNLIAMLDEVGVNTRLGIISCSSLFDENKHLLHSTSIFRYPTLLKGKPISTAKSGLRLEILKDMVTSCFDDECRQLDSNVLYIPLGQGVADILLSLSQNGKIREEMILAGMPHPSGANAERISYFLGRKDRDKLSTKTNPDKIDNAKAELLAKI